VVVLAWSDFNLEMAYINLLCGFSGDFSNERLLVSFWSCSDTYGEDRTEIVRQVLYILATLGARESPGTPKFRVPSFSTCTHTLCNKTQVVQYFKLMYKLTCCYFSYLTSSYLEDMHGCF